MRILFFVIFIATQLSAAEGKKGTLLIDGKILAEGFQMEAIFHSMEVKPVGTVLDLLCGAPIEMEGSRVCLGMPVGRTNTYYVVIHKSSDENIFARANLSVLKKIPPIYSYLGFGVGREEQFPKYVIEKQYELRITE